MWQTEMLCGVLHFATALSGSSFHQFISGFCFKPSETKAENGAESRLPDPGTQLSIDIALGRKRKIESSTNDDSDDEGSLAPPSNDIYRQRQQKKVKWRSEQ